MMLITKRLRSNPPLFVSIVSFIIFTLFLFNSSSSSSKPPSPSNTTKFRLGTLRIPVTSSSVWEEKKRHLVEEGNRDNKNASSLIILAAKTTQRRDPLDSFHIYTGGYNLSNVHYFSSVGFTAAPFFIIAGVWFVLFGLCLSCICLCYCCCPREPYGYSRICYALSLIFLILFTISAIVGCILLYSGQAKFHSITTKTLDYVVHQANVTAENLRNVSDSLAAAKGIAVVSRLLPNNIQNDINNIQKKINDSGTTLSTRTKQNSKDIQDSLDTTRLSLIVIAAVMLTLAFIGFLLSILGMRCLVYTLVILGWILVAGTFILCGIFLLFHNVVADTCVAMDEWVLNPTAKTAMDDIIPCVDNATAQQTLQQSKIVTYQLVDVVDAVLNNISNQNLPSQVGAPLYYNQSGPLVPILCNPFNSDYSNRACAAGEVSLRNATQVWRNYKCQVSPSGVCLTPGRLTPSMYQQMASAVNVSYALYHYGPFLVDLEDCTFVRKTFTKISNDYCPNLRKYTEWVYVGLVLVSGAVMLSLVFWVIYARERKHRVYTKRFNARHPQRNHEAI